jgi:hypothetical protein
MVSQLSSMNEAERPFADAARSRKPSPMLAWPRLRFALVLSTGLGLLVSLSFVSSIWSVLLRANALGLSAVLVFGLLERWPRQLPRWCARWVVQVAGVALAMPLASYAIYMVAYGTLAPLAGNAQHVRGYITFAVMGLLVAPWWALAALVRQKDAWANAQALSFELERSELQRQAVDARLHLLQAQVAPHFLFNTLANIQALVDVGSPQASSVLRSLIAYLRASVPRLGDGGSTLGQELEQAKAYLELMYMRMPDRLQFAVEIDEAAKPLRCPPMTLLTLVENAVRHGIDPSEEGGRIDIAVRMLNGRCCVMVTDSGVGLQTGTGGLGTGLAMLKERLQLSFDSDVQMSLVEHSPNGVCATLEFPAELAVQR